MVTALICVIIVAICVYAVISYRKKIKSGCCGGDCSCDSQNKKVRKYKLGDYAYKITVYIDGMTCGHCKARVESLLSSDDDCIAAVDLEKKYAYIWSAHPFDEVKIKETIINNGYKFVRFSLDN